MSFLKSGLITAERKVLLFVIAAMGVLSVYRAYDYWVTGFFVADESGYYNDALKGTIYGFRWFFGWMNIALFRILGIHGVTAYAFLLPFYLFFWATVTVCTFYAILKLLRFNEITIIASLLSSLFLVSFVLLSLGFLTEPVGLSFAMLGVYFMLRCIVRDVRSDRSLMVSALLSALFFVAAEGTREPYEIFSVGGIALIILVVFTQRNKLSSSAKSRRQLVMVATVALFVVPSAFFLFFPNDIYSQQVVPTSTGFVGGVAQTAPPPVATVTSTSTFAVTVTSTYTLTISHTINNTVTTTYSTSFSTFTTNSSTTTTSTSVHPFSILNYRIGNTFVIFFGGLVLGWGPILVVVALIGFVAAIGMVRAKTPDTWLVFLLALYALGSYFVVSFIFATDPNYLTFHNYSTILRFSDTALPAYFLLAPLAFSMLSTKRRYLVSVFVVLIAFLLVAVPTYEVYAASSLTSYAGTNPFSLSYRSDAVIVRNYIQSHPGNGPYNIIGDPGSWTFTPGTDVLPSVMIYTTDTGTSVQNISYTQFLADRWTSFYMFVTPGARSLGSNASYLVQMISPSSVPSNETVPYSVVSKQAILTNPDFTFYEIELSWQ